MYKSYVDFNPIRPPRWHRGSGLDCGSEDPGLIPGLPSTRVGPLMARRLKTSSDVPMLVSGKARHAKNPLAAHGVVCPAAGQYLENWTTVPSLYS